MSDLAEIGPPPRTVVILPSLDERRDGIAPFAFRIVRQLPGSGIGLSFAAPAPLGPRADGEPGADRLALARDGRALADALAQAEAGCVWLHYVGFGYAPDACPQWLLDGLAIWKQAGEGRRLHIFFHELATEEPVWTRTFWRQGRQRRIIRGLALLADRAATNCSYFSRQLRDDYGVPPGRLDRAPSGATLPLRPVDAGPTKTRDLSVLVFGLRGTRRSSLQAHRRLLQEGARRGVIGRVIVAGAGAEAGEAEFLREAAEVLAAPDLDAAALQTWIGEVDCGLVWNWPAILTKSSVFANLCAAGVPAIVGRRGPDESDLPVVGPAFLACGRGAAEIESTLRQLGDPQVRAEMRRTARVLADGYLAWATTAETLARHLHA